MFIPYGTDTAIYHWPIATGVLIALNLIAYPIQWSIQNTLNDESAVVLEFDDEEEMDAEDAARLINQFLRNEGPGWIPYALSHGDGLHPVQWLTSFFMHAGIFHLLGNMIFLWAFGVVVEGKVGPFVFTAIYMAIGVVQNIVEQLLFLGTVTGPSLGASSAIYGIMMLCMLFAPKDNLHCFTIVFYRPLFFSVPILLFGLFYFLWDFGFALFSGFGMGTPLLHVMGAIVGVAAGAIMLRTSIVKTDDSDLFSLVLDAAGVDVSKRKKKPTKRELAQEKENVELAELNREKRIQLAWKSFDTHFAAGNVAAATGVYETLHRREPSQHWDEGRLIKVVRYFMEQKDWKKVVTYSREYLNSFSSRAHTIRINLAKIYVLHLESPGKAIKVLREINASEIPPDQLSLAKKLVARSNQMIREGTIEFDDE